MSTTGIAFYNAARAEINERIKLRDQIILSFIVSSGAVIGLAIGNVGGIGATIALVIPYLGLGTTILVATHNTAITRLGSYFQELSPAINECRMASAIQQKHEFLEIKPWDISESYRKHGKASSRSRMIGQLVIIFMPTLFSLYVSWGKFNFPFQFPNDMHSILWVWGLIAAIISGIYLIYIHLDRVKVIEQQK